MAPRAKSAIITCAPTGAIHTPTMSPALPVTPEEIAEAALGAARAGAAIVHLHVRDPQDGHPVQDPGLFKEVLAIVTDRSDVVVNLTTGGSPHMTVDERIAPAVQLAPELASLNMGSMNFGLFPMLDRYPAFQHEWERERLADKDVVFKNTYADIERILKTCGDQGTRFEFECYDTAHLYNLANMLDRGLVRPPLFVQTVFGLLGGTGADFEDLRTCTGRRTACSATTSSGRCWAPAPPRCGWAPSPSPSGATRGSAWRTPCGTAPAGSRNPTPPRSSGSPPSRACCTV